MPNELNVGISLTICVNIRIFLENRTQDSIAVAFALFDSFKTMSEFIFLLDLSSLNVFKLLCSDNRIRIHTNMHSSAVFALGTKHVYKHFKHCSESEKTYPILIKTLFSE